MKAMPVVLHYQRVTEAYPRQWIFTFADGTAGYVRYRSGFLSWGRGKTHEDAIESAELVNSVLTHAYVSDWRMMTDKEMIELMKRRWDFSTAKKATT